MKRTLDLHAEGAGGGASRVVPSSPVGWSDGRGYGSVCWFFILLKWDSVHVVLHRGAGPLLARHVF